MLSHITRKEVAILPSMEGIVATLIISIRYAKMKNRFGRPLVYHKMSILKKCTFISYN